MGERQDDSDRELAKGRAEAVPGDVTSHDPAREHDTFAMPVESVKPDLAPPARFQSSRPEPPSDPTRSPSLADPNWAWGPLRILEEIGRGSFGRVVKAWEPRLQRQVALKLLDGVPSKSEEAVVAEARLLAQIRHDNVVTVYGADCYDGRVGFWMEYIEGRTLWQMHHQYGAFGAQEALLLAVDLCHALAAVHRAGFVHGDVKAQNVMRQVGGRIVLADFGAARLAQAASPSRPMVTPHYAAPEALLGAPPSPLSDLYSVGVLLFYLTTGEFPASGGTVEELRVAHASGRRTLLRDVRPDLSPSFIRVVDAATAALPEERPESAGALEALIERALGRVSVVAHTNQPPRLAADADTSIAVLPFADLSKDKTLAYFCDGLAEELIHVLSGIQGLRVVPRASAFSLELRGSDPQELGSILRVRTLLQGSVTTSGEQIRVTVRLTDAVTGFQLWSKRFIRDTSDIFGVQEEIANAACGELGIRLVPRGRRASALRPGSDGSDVYTLYLKGRYCWNQRTELALQKSTAYFHAAIDKEPEYAPAYAALAEAYTTLGLYGVLAPADIMPRARLAARRALEIASDSASAHAASACIAAVYEWDWTEAARSYHRAIDVNPDDPSAHHWYAINYLVPLGRFDEAATELGLAAAADPLSMAIRASVGIRSYFAHDFGFAERELRHCLEVDPGSPTARLFLGLTLVELSRTEDAIRELETATQVAASPEMTAALAYAYARGGRLEQANALLQQLLVVAEQRYVSPSLIAQVHAGLGNAGAALEWLERASVVRAVDLAWLAVRPVFDALRPDPRFNALVARIFP